MDLQNNVNELITLRTNGMEDAMKSMKDIESLFDKVTSNYRPLLNGERYLSDVEVSHRLKVSRRTLQDYRDNGTLPTLNWVVRYCIVRVTWRLYSKGVIILSTGKRSFEKSC